LQYTITNIIAFIILIVIGYNLFLFANNNLIFQKLKDKNNSPIQLISQLKGFFFINPILTLSLCIILLSFIGLPPLIGFFGKQMVLAAALENGYTFLTLVGILTSVIGAVYYLIIMKTLLFEKSNYIKTNNLSLTTSTPSNLIISFFVLLIICFLWTPDELLLLSNLTAKLSSNTV
jgi:NADH-ubiquinone oxidoreductase chain 2